MNKKTLISVFVLCGVCSTLGQTTRERVADILAQTESLKTEFDCEEDFVGILTFVEKTLSKVNVQDSEM